ncbi:MAG TPA: CBS domain-containing protein [Polyangiaceae bacterium]
MKVRDMVHGEPATAAPEESAASAWGRMQTARVDHLVVVSRGRVVGLLSRQDMSGPSGGAHRRMGRRVADLMRGEVLTVSPQTDVRSAVSRMRRQHLACLPVVERGQLVGAITVSDLLQLLEQERRA